MDQLVHILELLELAISPRLPVHRMNVDYFLLYYNKHICTTQMYENENEKYRLRSKLQVISIFFIVKPSEV